MSVGDCSRVHPGPAVVGAFQADGAEAMNLTCVGFRCGWLRVQDEGQAVGKNLWYVGTCGCLDGGT